RKSALRTRRTATFKQERKLYELAYREHPCHVILSTGDMLKNKGIDVLVNTENDYMQMARVFESNTISSVLRYHGSAFNRDGQLTEDSVQKELNTLLESRHTVRPIGIGTVFATHAGHPESDLQQKNRARYIFHVTTVQVNYNFSEYTPVEAVSSNQGIINCVRNALNKVLEVNQQRGVISPETTERYQIEVDK